MAAVFGDMEAYRWFSGYVTEKKRKLRPTLTDFYLAFPSLHWRQNFFIF